MFAQREDLAAKDFNLPLQPFELALARMIPERSLGPILA